MTISPDVAEDSVESEPNPASELLARNRRRRRIRKWVGIGSIPILIVITLLVVKILSMYAAAHMSIASFITGDGSGTSRAAQWQYPVNVFEPFKAPFNNAVGLAANAQYTPARAEFEKTLELVTGLEECAVRINLSITIERLGDLKDEAGDPYAAKKLYDEALLNLLDGPKDCQDEEKAAENSSDPNRDMGSQREQLEQRLEEKQEQQQQKQDGQGGEQPTDPEEGDGGGEETDNGPGQDKLDEIEERLGQGDRDRDDIGRDGEDPWSDYETDKPW